MSASANPPPREEGRDRLKALRVVQSASAWFAARFGEFAADAEAAIARAAAADPIRQRPLLDALARFRERRGALEDALLSALAARTARLSGSQPSPRPRPRLELMPDEDLAIALAIAPLTRQARQVAAEEWARLEDCLGQIFDPPPGEASWPLDPAEVIAAFREATEVLGDFDRDALLILLDGFGACVLARLPELYRRLLVAFAEELGLRALERRRQAPGAGRGDRDFEIWKRLERLLGRGEAADERDEDDAPTAELLHALSVLQGLAEAIERGDARSAPLKTRLLDRLAGPRGGRAPRLSARDERGIDLVGLLFDFILRDPAIPERVRLILARLQIPCIKAVLIDPRSLADREGAPRRLLDVLADSAVGWSEEADRDGRFLAQIEAAVETVRREFEQDLEVFERALKTFQSFHASERQRAETAAQRHLAAIRGRERLRLVRAETGARIAALVGERALPSTLRHLLFGPWAHYLVLTVLRHGEDSPASREAFGLAERLVAATSGGRGRASSEEIAQLEALLRHGLHAVAVHDGEVEALVGWLHGYLGSADPIRTSPEIVPGGELEPLAPPFVSDPGGERIAPPGSALGSGAEEPQLGSWWCFREDGRERRGRLVWKSPLDGRLLFVHQRGGPSLELDAPSFAAARAAGKAVPLPTGESLVERALRGIDDALTTAAGHAP